MIVVKSSGSASHLGKTALFTASVLEAPVCFSNFVQRLRTGTNLEPRYLWYFLNCDAAATQIDQLSSTTTGLRNISGDILGRLGVPVLAPGTQRAIVQHLDRETTRIDALIAARRRMVDLLEEQRTVILLSHVAPHLLARGQAPGSWSPTRLKYLFQSPVAGAWGGEADGGLLDTLCIRVADFDRKRFRVDERAATLRSVEQAVRSKCVLRQGDILIEKSGGGDAQPVGFAVVFDLDAEAICSNFVARLRPRPKIEPAYAGLIMAAAYRAGCNVSFIKQTTGIQNLDMAAYLSLRWYIPDRTSQVRICKHLQSVFSTIDRINETLGRQMVLLQEHRQALITAAVTGQLNILEAA